MVAIISDLSPWSTAESSASRSTVGGLHALTHPARIHPAQHLAQRGKVELRLNSSRHQSKRREAKCIQTMTTPDVSNLNYTQLLELKKRLDEQIDSKRAEEIKVLADGYVKKAQAAGFTAAEALEAVRPYVPGAPQSTKARPVLYRDPSNLQNAWSGRGRAPRWLVTYEEQGRFREEFKVA